MLHAFWEGGVGQLALAFPIMNDLVEDIGTDLSAEMCFIEETCWHNWITVSLFLCAYTLSLVKESPHLAVVPLHGEKNLKSIVSFWAVVVACSFVGARRVGKRR